MLFEGVKGRFWPGYFEIFDLLHGAAGDRHLGTDDIVNFGGGAPGHRLSDPGETGGALGRYRAC